MDKLYIGDIPPAYHFAQYGSYYIDLYDQPYLERGFSYNYYRVYLYDNYFTYELKNNTYTSYTSTFLSSVDTSSSYTCRRDFPSILFMVLVFCIFFIYITNILTSAVFKGGVLNDLL